MAQSTLLLFHASPLAPHMNCGIPFSQFATARPRISARIRASVALLAVSTYRLLVFHLSAARTWHYISIESRNPHKSVLRLLTCRGVRYAAHCALRHLVHFQHEQMTLLSPSWDVLRSVPTHTKGGPFTWCTLVYIGTRRGPSADTLYVGQTKFHRVRRLGMERSPNEALQHPEATINSVPGPHACSLWLLHVLGVW